MFKFTKNIFGGKTDHDEFVEKLVKRSIASSHKFELIGQQIADDCVEYGLRNGKYATLSDMEETIRQRHLYNAQVVTSGFLRRIQEYVNSGDVINFSVEGGDVLIVHKDHATDILKRLHGGNIDISSAYNGGREDPKPEVIQAQEAHAKDIQMFILEINNASTVLANTLEETLPARRAVELLSKLVGKKREASSGWRIKAEKSYSGGTRHGYIQLSDPNLISYLQPDNPTVYVSIAAKERKLMGSGDEYPSYFGYSYYLHSGNIRDMKNDLNKEHCESVERIMSEFNIPTSLPELFHRSGKKELMRRWMTIFQQSPR